MGFLDKFFGNSNDDGKAEKVDSGLGESAALKEAHLTSKKMMRFESENAVSREQERYLAPGAVLFTQTGDSSRTLKLIGLGGSPKIIKGKLKHSWGLEDAAGAINSLEYLCVATYQTKQLDPVYEGIISGQLRETNEYATAKAMLLNFGYSEKELSTLPTLAAWDYGRCAFLARDSENCGWIDEATAWKYMRIGSENISKAYSSWRQYLAGYVLGRALWGSDCTDIVYHVEYLLKSPNSPYQRISFQ